MALDYSHTCPDINKSISEFKSFLDDSISDILEECSPKFQGVEKNKYKKSWIDTIYSGFEDSFEKVRKTNEDMRKEADRQIENAEEKVSDLQSEISDLESKISDLEAQLSDL